ncbi:MAG: hypothetical protein R3E31_12745 [Chloroflexota bacterium]
MQHRSSQTAVFLIRCWIESDASVDNLFWRFRLENPRTGDARSFTDQVAMQTFLASYLDELIQDFKENNS